VVEKLSFFLFLVSFFFLFFLCITIINFIFTHLIHIIYLTHPHHNVLWNWHDSQQNDDPVQAI